MKRSPYQRLASDSRGANICPVHQLVNYPKVVAEMDARKLRDEAVADTPNTLAQAGICSGTGNWHIFIPTKARMRAIRKRAGRSTR